MFVGSERGSELVAIIYTQIETAKLNNVDPQACLIDARPIAGHKIKKLDALLLLNYMRPIGRYHFVSKTSQVHGRFKG